MFFIQLLQLSFSEFIGLCFVVIGVIPSILFRSWGSAVLYYVAILFVSVWIELVARRAIKARQLQ